MKQPSKKKTEVKPKIIMTINYTPPEIEMDVCQILYKMMEKYSIKNILAQLYANTIMEGLCKCTMLVALMDKKEVDKTIENVDASHALLYLKYNWDHCVKEGEKLRLELKAKKENNS